MTRYDPALHHRRSIRLPTYDYRQAGAYFVTLCTDRRTSVFGAIVDEAMHRNAYGEIVAEDWAWLAERYPAVRLDAFVVMPNHLHGIVMIAASEDDGREGGPREGGSQVRKGGSWGGEDGSRTAPTEMGESSRKSLGRLIGAFKTVSTKHVNEWREAPGVALWQRNYYEHIIRDDSDLARIREYIAANPARWREDSEYVPTPPS